MRPRGPLIQIVGPDGTGKSTLAGVLVDRLARLHEVRHSYFRPGLLPLPGRLLGKPPPGLVTDPHGRQPHGSAKATVRLVYYAVDFVVGYWAIYWPILRRGGVVVVERGWQDMVVDNKRYLMPSPVPARMLSRLIPRPDVIVVLEAPTVTILERKDELTRDEIERQLAEWSSSAAARHQVIRLDARATPAELAAVIVDRLARSDA